MLVSLHIHATALEHNPLLFEPQPLLQSRMTAQQNSPIRADNAMPGNVGRASMQGPGHLPRRAFIPGRSGHRAVRRHTPTRDFADDRQHLLLHPVASGLRRKIEIDRLVFLRADRYFYFLPPQAFLPCFDSVRSRRNSFEGEGPIVACDRKEWMTHYANIGPHPGMYVAFYWHHDFLLAEPLHQV